MMIDDSIAGMRKEYKLQTLDTTDVSANPITQFQQWFDEARNAHVPEPNAMTLSTATTDGRPSARIVLLKGVENNRFVFYTNYESQKGKEIGNNPVVALTFFWGELERQVRVEGTVKKATPEQSSDYFHSRPRGSQIGAWVSNQSQEIENREVLQKRLDQYTADFEGKEVPKPDHWGGYEVTPDKIEFWQGRPSRLHDRVCYTLQDGAWQIARLAP